MQTGFVALAECSAFDAVLNYPEMNERQGMWFIYSENQKNVGVNGGYVVLQGNE